MYLHVHYYWTCITEILLYYGINAIDTFKSFINNIVITKHLTCELLQGTFDFDTVAYAVYETITKDWTALIDAGSYSNL